jgi:glycosyltransferase involved in cell wall biosynthesis
MTRLAITQPYVPLYRVPLWEGVLDRLAEHGVEGRVFFGGDARQLAARAERGDAAEVPWAEQVRVRSVGIGRRMPRLQYRLLPAGWRDAPLLTEMAVGNGNAWRAVARNQPFATFGHGAPMGRSLGPADRVENVLNRRARHVLTYMEAGRTSVLSRARLASANVTAFGNTTDTRQLTSALDAVSDADAAAFRSAHGIPDDARIALVIGALNAHKRLDVLVEAARSVLGLQNTWWVVVAGDGPLRSEILDLQRSTGRVTWLGQAAPADFAPAARLASVILNPGRVGLIAVDALAMRLPIITLSDSRHAPEFDYLSEGRTVFSTEPTAASFASCWASFESPPLLASDDELPSIERASSRIADALLRSMFEGGAP